MFLEAYRGFLLFHPTKVPLRVCLRDGVPHLSLTGGTGGPCRT